MNKKAARSAAFLFISIATQEIDRTNQNPKDGGASRRHLLGFMS
jgi:hypothetical protein